MSLSDESFPDDDLLLTKINCKCNVSSCISSSSPNDRNLSASTSGQSSSGETTQSDPVKIPERHNQEDYTQKVQSCQDLHSVYTKRRYPHVKSKVREFIENQKAEEEMRKATREYIRRISVPEVIDGSNNELEIKAEPAQETDLIDINQALVDKEEEMMSLKALNEYLQSSLQEKMIEATRLRRNMDCMRVELMNAKDKVKRHSIHSSGMEFRNQARPRLSLPTLVYKQPRNTTATQTDFSGVNLSPTDTNNNNIGTYEQQAINISFSTDHLGHIQRQIRRRNSSNPPTPTGERTPTNRVESDRSDSAIDTEEGDSSSENVLREEFEIFEKNSANDTTILGQSMQMKKKRSFKRKFKWIFGPCGKCSDKRNNSVGEQYSQVQDPLLDSFEQKLRAADNNLS